MSLGLKFGLGWTNRRGGGGAIVPGIISAGAGSYNWSGDVMTPVVDYKLPANGSSYAFSGQDASFVTTRVISGAGSSYTYTGQSATLTKASGSYTGPGDINGAAKVWYGLRAFSAAYATAVGNAIDIVDSGGANAATITVLASGDLDTSTLNTWIGLHGTASVTKLYDQSGAGLDLSQAVVAKMPTVNVTGINSKPVLAFSGSQFLTNGTGFTQAQSLTIAAVAKRTANTGAYNCIIGDSTNPDMYFNNSSGNVAIFGGTSIVTTTATENVAHCIQALYAGASSKIYVDGGAAANVSTGSNGFANRVFGIGAINTTPTFPLTGLVAEAGVWAGDKSGNAATLYTNENTYWNV